VKISICIPVYNGAKTISKLVSKVKYELNKYNDSLEFVLVNDASPDNSEKVCEELALNNQDIKFISLRKNYGEHNAVMCALNFITGDYAVIIDDDFQNPPEEIIKLIDEAKKGYDVVYSKYKKKNHNVFRNMGSKFNDIVATQLLNKPKGLYLSSFKVIEKSLVEELIKYQGPFPYIDGLILRCTNNISSVYVNHNKREDSRSNYTFKKLISLWLNMFINFSVKPLRIFTVIGLSISILSALLALDFIVEKLINPANPIGWASIMVSIFFFSGIQLIFLGLIGEYLGKLYLDQNRTPQWVIKKKVL